MKTTELYVEQVLIGAIVLFALGLPWAPEILNFLSASKTVDKVVGGTIAIGVSFLLGILFDRFADTLTEPLEKHNRIRFVWESQLTKFKRRQQAKVENTTEDNAVLKTIYGNDDPFPEDHIRVKTLAQNGGIVDLFDYQRSRIRLTRAMAVYGPALTVASVIGISRKLLCANGETWGYASLLIVLPYCVAVGWNKHRERFLGPNPDKIDYLQLAPRTDDVAGAMMYARLHYLNRSTPITWKDALGLKLHSGRIFLLQDPMVVVGLLLLLVGAVLGVIVFVSGHQPIALLAEFFGVIVSIMAAWSWWRINKTYWTYLAKWNSSTETAKVLAHEI